jgi:hypothetical protein
LRVDIRRTTVILAPAARVWATLRDFNGHSGWHPAVAESAIEDGGPADQVGAVRDFRLNGGARIREQLLTLSDRRMSFSYCILEAPEPLRNYVATLRLRPVTDVGACLVEWRSSFEPPESDRERLARFVRDDIVDAGLASLQRQFSDAPRAAALAIPSAPNPRPAATGIETDEIVITRYGGPEVLELRRGRALIP